MSRDCWRAHKLEELGSISRGRSRHRPRNDPSLYGGQYPFVQTGDIKNAELYLYEYSQTYNDKGLSQSKQWDAGTLCITIAANIAETAILGIPACFPDSVIGFISNPTKSDVRFIKYYIDLIKQNMQAVSHGTTQDNLSVSKLQTFDFIVPSVALQKGIADTISAYDDLIENNTRRIAILEEMAQTLYREWFVHFRFPGHETQVPGTYEVPGTLTDRDGRLPEGWKTAVLGDIAKEKRASVKPSDIDPETPYIGLGHMPKRSIALSDWGMANEAGSTKLIFSKGDILFGKIRPYFHKVGVAPVDGVCSTDTIVIVPKSPEWFSITLGCVSSSEFVDHATQTSKGTKMPRADWSVLVKYPIAIPSEDLLLKFNQMIENMVELVRNNICRNANLRQTRDLLLPRLISGELDVSRLEVPGTSEVPGTWLEDDL